MWLTGRLICYPLECEQNAPLIKLERVVILNREKEDALINDDFKIGWKLTSWEIDTSAKVHCIYHHFLSLWEIPNFGKSSWFLSSLRPPPSVTLHTMSPIKNKISINKSNYKTIKSNCPSSIDEHLPPPNKVRGTCHMS